MKVISTGQFTELPPKLIGKVNLEDITNISSISSDLKYDLTDKNQTHLI